MIVKVAKKDLAVLASIADGKKIGPTDLVELTYKDGCVTIAATNGYIVAMVVLPGVTPDELQALSTDRTSVYLEADLLRKALKQIPRSISRLQVSVEGDACDLVTAKGMYQVDLRGMPDACYVSKYGQIKADRLAHAEPNAYKVDSKNLKQAIAAAHDLNQSDSIVFKPLKRSAYPVLEWASARPGRGYAKVLMIAKYANSEGE